MAGGTKMAESSSGPTEKRSTEALTTTDPSESSSVRPPRVGNYLGRHRLSASIGRLQQEVQSLKSELEELDKMEPSSAACKEILASMKGVPDALLPITKGPENSAWERWFQPVRSSRKWWKNKDSDFS
ncbi:Guanine nucleotide-binding protein subunit gamma 1 [Platanthera zijinensis]|uniref:Guanine nucleotide-binding protein subunit gamma 1 n=1 Tax=Platanthera zijinensis TaxID=2320716 RepID=A0AAP0AXM6_9ASPA